MRFRAILSAMEPPTGKAIILCDQVITDQLSGNKTLVGTFNRIQASAFPAQFPRMAVYVALVNGSGPATIRILLKSETAAAPLLEARGEVNFEGPNEVYELTFNFLGVPLREPGNYLFEVYAADDFVFETRFTVVRGGRN